MELIPSSFDFKQYLLASEGTEKVVPASNFADAVIERLYGDTVNNSPVTPWSKLDSLVQFRPGEVTLWAGINGHGKTLVTSQVALHLLVQNCKVCIASFEMKGEATMARMIKQSAATGTPSVDYIKRFSNWTDNLLWVYDQQGVCDSETLRGVMTYAAQQLGVTQFFVDSMMKVVRGDDDYNGQKNFVNEVCAIAQDTGMHIHLIAHVKKKEDELSLPNKFDVKGSSSITDLVDNVCIVWRNRIKERNLSKTKLTPEQFEEEKKAPDAILQWNKQRHFDWEGKLNLWLNVSCQSFSEKYISSPYFWEPPTRPVLQQRLTLKANDEIY